MNFIYEPWFICLLVSVLLTIIYYAVKLQLNNKKQKKKDKDENQKNDLVNTFIATL